MGFKHLANRKLFIGGSFNLIKKDDLANNCFLHLL